MAAAVIIPGTLLHGRYRIVRKIGAGGMGAVFEAVDTRLQNTVAVKQTTAGPRGEHAFEREAKILAALRHPALPVVTDYFSEGDGQFLVMQYIEGDDLSRLLRRQVGPCALDDVLAWARIILGALSYLHSHQPPVIHRDIKPANLRRTPRGEIVLLDFGLAKTRVEQETRLATDQSVYGYTPNYAPPEQIDGRGTDARSDIYALGATLYHLSVGLPPRAAADRADAVREGRPDPLVPPHLSNTQLGESFSRVLMRALQLDPRHRFASADEMRAALEHEKGERQAAGRATPAGGPRRVDAAMPSQTEVGRQTDLIVQVRFADSPALGLEDWPTRRRPEQIEQGSDALQLVYPVDPDTGLKLPARVRVKVVAPDFTIGGAAEHVVDVPPEEYSKRLTFLLTARRAGFCRVNVEVSSLDAVFLGSIPVEVEASAGPSDAPDDLRVANLVLQVFARQLRDQTGAHAAMTLESMRATAADRAAAERAAAAPGWAATAAQARPPHLAVPLEGSPQTTVTAAPALRTGRGINKALMFVPLAVVVLGAATMWWQLRLSPATVPIGTTAASSPAPVTAAPMPPPMAAAAPAPAPATATPTSARASAPRPLPAATAAPPPPPAAPPPTPSVVVVPAPTPTPTPTPTPFPAPTPAPTVRTIPTTPVPTPTPTASPSSPEQDRASISAVLDALAAGYSTKDVAAIVKVWPAAPAAELQATFASYVSHKMTMSDVKIVLDGDRATATATVATATTVREGESLRTRNETRQMTWRLQKMEVNRRTEGVFFVRERVWVIVGPG